MSVLIKGMEMPKNGKHPYWVVIHSNGTVEYNENKGQGWKTSKAVLIPPHGDLIERDKTNLTDFEIVMCNGDYKEGMKMLLEKIESAPTIISAEPLKRNTHE